ncbi:hypothetical protein SAMN05446037_100270 [Anaerovirgula multivorans]|uniref:Uncharacterized protein n=1 Tax=Anaerovirgula multivorans TaxID=312168 RepID=A0A239AJ14_9FIRM|nr:hypothetical protein [Anaerovirgula multivorans]SNR95540.1 hypothetical protein SAMN05446037_100270 [Anaerovirgula multivorans]
MSYKKYPPAIKQSTIAKGTVVVPATGQFSQEVTSKLTEMAGGNLFISSGTIVKPTLTYNTGEGTVTLGVGKYRLFHTEDFTGNITEHDLDGGTFSLVEGYTRYLVANYNNGSPIVQLISDLSVIDFSSVTPIYTISRFGDLQSGFSAIDWGETGSGLSSKLLVRIIKTQRFARQEGLSISMDTSLNLTISAGKVWNGVYLKSFEDAISNVDECFLRVWNGTSWDRNPATTVNNTQYNSEAGLVNLTDGNYAVVWIYRDMGTDKRIHMFQGTGDYDLNEAKASQVPSNIPAVFGTDTLQVGRIIIQKSSTTPTQIDNAWDSTFTPSAVSSHGELTGLSGGHDGTYDHLPIYNEDDPILMVDKFNNYVRAGGNRNDYVQLDVKNTNNGTSASADLVASNDISTENSNYVDLGINGSMYSDPDFSIAGANDAYLYSSDGNLTVGTKAANKDVVIHAGGTLLTDECARVKPSGETIIKGNVQSLNLREHGNVNVAVGSTAGNTTGTGIHNVSIGANASNNLTTGANSVAVGTSANRSSTTATGIVAIGPNSLRANVNGNFNIGIGESALRGNVSGQHIIGVGTNAGRYLANGTTARETGDNGVYLGRETRASANNTTREVVIGANAIGNGSDSVTIGATTNAKTIINGNTGIKTDDPQATLHMVGSVVSNKHLDTQAQQTGFVMEGKEGRFQVIADDSGSGGAGLQLTNAPSSGNNAHWHINHVGVTLGDGLLFRHSTSNATGLDTYTTSGFVNAMYLRENGNAGFGGNLTPSHTVDVDGTMRVTTSVRTPVIRPLADGVSAINITKVNGTTSVMSIDTTNNRVAINTINPASPLVTKGTTTDGTTKIVDLLNSADTSVMSVDTAGNTIVSGEVTTVATGKLKRVSDGVWVTATNTVEYFSPNQHGGIHGTVYRKYFSVAANGSLGGTTTIALGVTPVQVFGVWGSVNEHGATRKYLIPTGNASSTDNKSINANVVVSNLNLVGNDNLRWGSGICWIDYTR